MLTDDNNSNNSNNNNSNTFPFFFLSFRIRLEKTNDPHFFFHYHFKKTQTQETYIERKRNEHRRINAKAHGKQRPGAVLSAGHHHPKRQSLQDEDAHAHRSWSSRNRSRKTRPDRNTAASHSPGPRGSHLRTAAELRLSIRRETRCKRHPQSGRSAEGVDPHVSFSNARTGIEPEQRQRRE